MPSSDRGYLDSLAHLKLLKCFGRFRVSKTPANTIGIMPTMTALWLDAVPRMKFVHGV